MYPEAPLGVDARTARRLVLGRQGLWPGRRWRSPGGIVESVRQVGSIQVDPLDVVGRSHDLALHARVAGYRPAHLAQALYEEHALFEWGGNLQIRSVEEYPYLLHRMRELAGDPHWEHFGITHKALIARVLREVEKEGPIGSRALPEGLPVKSYRARKDTGLALYYLWHTGKLMICGRSNGDRVYDLPSRILPPRYWRAISASTARRHLAEFSLRMFGLANASEVHSALHWMYPRGHSSRTTREWIASEERRGRLVRVEVDGWKGPQWTGPAGAEALVTLSQGDLPREWRPLGPTTDEEAIFLAPLDIVSARGRARRLFGFEYVWEVYKPLAQRRWGYYILPILFGDSLPARADLRYDRAHGSLRVLGFWLEEQGMLDDPRFASALGRGLAQLKSMTGAERVDVGGIRSRRFRKRVESSVK